MQSQKPTSFACERCRAGKRKCDSAKPQCSLCRKQNRECVYITVRPRKRKYWDEDYVRALEDQVQSLLAVQKDQEELATSRSLATNLNAISPPEHEEDVDVEPDVSTPQPLDFKPGPNVADPDPQDTSVRDRSQQAMEELSVMMWRTNVGDGVTIVNDASTGTQYRLDPENKNPETHIQPPASILAYCQDTQLMQEFAKLFLDNINSEHQFTTYKSADFLQDYPWQNVHLAFLHSAIIATGATFSDREDAIAIGDSFVQFAESLIFTCCRNNPNVAVIQGLCMLSWRSLALGRDHFGWMFISMAAGICVHLRLHVLALDEFAARSFEPNIEDIRTFWMFYIIDRTAISILGRNCALPWRRVNVPDFESTIATDTADLGQISFAWQCKLWYFHDQNMDQIFAPTFETLPLSQQVRLLVSTHEALNAFFKSRDRRLDLTGDATPKSVLLFHMAYQMAMLITMPPFLRLFASSKASELGDTTVMFLILRSLTYSASAMARHVRTYRRVHGFKTANPVMIHHLLSAAIVHLMNATTNSPSLRKQSARWLRLCLDLLAQLAEGWPLRANKSIKVIRVLAQRWGVTFALPLEYSRKIEPSTELDVLASQQTSPQETSISPEMSMGGDFGVEYQYPGLFDENVDFTGVDLNSFSFGTLDMPQMDIHHPPQPGIMDTSAGMFMQTFGGLNECENFDWLFGATNV